MRKIMLHLPAYREPELIPTIKDALAQAKNPKRIHFGICRQYNPEDGFDNLDEFRDDPRFKISDIPYEEAKGLPYARAIINEELLDDEDFVLQLDAHHRFAKDWDATLIKWYDKLKKKGKNPLICGYLPYYNPFNDPAERVNEPWFSEAACFYPHGTIFIRPTGYHHVDYKTLKEPVPARFISGHFCFGPNKWAKTVKHDPEIYFSGEELNLSVRSFTHGYDLFHPHQVVVWHATMREERDNMLIWDDQSKRGDDMWWRQQDIGRARIRQLIGVEDNGYDLGEYGLGNVRTIRDYEKYAGIHFKKKSFQKYTRDNKFPPNPIIEDEQEWEDSFMFSFYHLVNVTPDQLPAKDYNFILIAYDDKDGNSIDSEYIDDYRLKQFLEEGKPIHYEKMFMTDENPARVVYWGHSEKRGWVERIESKI
ncbi:UDP-N-acetylglucosamine-transferase [bacterium]|nr:UDP-N-acetylglucosamine-transferase [bacterium]